MLAAVLQFTSTADKKRNLDIAGQLVGEAASAGAQLLVLPELFNCLGSFREIIASAESCDGETATWLSQLARSNKIFLCGGSICEAAETPGKGYNTSLFFDPEGALVCKYRKQHLFDIDIPGKVTICESEVMLPGDEVVTALAGDTRVGFATCYDLRFPEIFRELSAKKIDAVCFPSAFTRVTGEAHWETLVRARAIENQCYMLAANQVGQHNENLESYGHSMIVDCWGNIVAQLHQEQVSFALGEINHDHLVKTRTNLPALKHRKFFPN